MLRAVTFDFWSTLFVDSRGRERERLRGAVLDEALRSEGHGVSDGPTGGGPQRRLGPLRRRLAQRAPHSAVR